MDGVLIVDKPEDWTSHDVVAKCRRILKTKRVGHTGTLDPFATGVLVILVGKATRLARFLDKDEKEYEALINFGFETDTGDRAGEMKDQGGRMKEEYLAETLEKVDWCEVFSGFQGEIEQTPPMYSAKKIEGKKLYELAREGIEIEREPVKVTIYELEKIKSEIPNPKSQIAVRVVCSAGTYIRVLAEDIGKKIGVGAHLQELRRTRAGKFEIEKAVSLEELEKAGEFENYLISMNQAISHLPGAVLDFEEVKKTKNGLKILRENLEIAENQPVRMFDESENLIAVGFYSVETGFIQPRVVVV